MTNNTPKSTLFDKEPRQFIAFKAVKPWLYILQHPCVPELQWKVFFNGSSIIERNRQMHIHKDIFKSADVIVTPTTGVTAYPITETAVKYGEFDYINGAALVRYQIAGNFLGLPAVTVPVGYDKVGMPIGFQFIGRPFSEATLIHISYAMQALCISSCQKPKVFYDLLSKQ